MNKTTLILVAVGGLGMLAGIWAKGYSDGKAWTTATN
jgi:hypothetical protein